MSGCARRVVDGGVETVTVEEDGRLKSKTVNGVAVPLDEVPTSQQDVQPPPPPPQQEQATSEL